jgi:hypothetical protein
VRSGRDVEISDAVRLWWSAVDDGLLVAAGSVCRGPGGHSDVQQSLTRGATFPA